MSGLDVRPFVFGGVAACAAEAATFPIDTAKTRLQLQGQRMDARLTRTPYAGLADCWRRVAAEEGVTVLYRGLAPALLRQASYGTIKFGLYDTLKTWLPPAGALNGGPHEEEADAARNMACAVVAGSVSSALANPTDVLKVRLQSRFSNGPSSSASPGIVASFLDVQRKEGLRGLYRGVCPTAARAAAVAGVQLPVYDFSKVFLVRHRLVKDGAGNHVVSSINAGFSACLVASPIDVVKTRMMGQRRLKELRAKPPPPESEKCGKSRVDKIKIKTQTESEKCGKAGGGKIQTETQKSQLRGEAARKIYRNSVHCVYETVRTEGGRALFKGFVPSFMRMGPWNIIFFQVYEKLNQLSPKTAVKRAKD